MIDPPAVSALAEMAQDAASTAEPCVDCRALVLFGATGDLARRMLWPSLYALHRDGLLPAGFRIVGQHFLEGHERFVGADLTQGDH